MTAAVERIAALHADALRKREDADRAARIRDAAVRDALQDGTAQGPALAKELGVSTPRIYQMSDRARRRSSDSLR